MLPDRIVTSWTRILAGVPLILALTHSPEARADDRQSALAALRPDDVTVTAGTFFTGFLIYEIPGPSVGVEIGWRTSAYARVIANAGVGVVWADGTVRSFTPVGVSLRVSPWQRGPLWAQAGLGAMPYVERISVVLPERTVNLTDFGATLTTRYAVGVRFAGWEAALGVDFNVGNFYETYTGNEALPWDNTTMVWVGRQLWTRRQP